MNEPKIVRLWNSNAILIAKDEKINLNEIKTSVVITTCQYAYMFDHVYDSFILDDLYWTKEITLDIESLETKDEVIVEELVCLIENIATSANCVEKLIYKSFNIGEIIKGIVKNIPIKQIIIESSEITENDSNFLNLFKDVDVIDIGTSDVSVLRNLDLNTAGTFNLMGKGADVTVEDIDALAMSSSIVKNLSIKTKDINVISKLGILSSLESLTIFCYELDSIPEGLFKNLRNLKFLDITNTQIEMEHFALSKLLLEEIPTLEHANLPKEPENM